nr:hypothetical protein [Tanacetum cinerariifolium]
MGGTTSYESATFPSLGKRKAHTELDFHSLQMHTQSIGRNLTPWFLGGCTLMMLSLALKASIKMAMEIDRISTIVFVLSG